MLKKTPSFVLGRSDHSTYWSSTPRGLRSLWPRWMTGLSILVDPPG